MPIYEYRCGECGHQQEFLQKVSDAPLVECPKCHKPGLTKLLSAAGFQLKGSGWYATDFKSKGAPAKKDSAGGDAKPADAKPADSKGGETKATAVAGGCGGGCACH
jgi:putative FmdB family regulatory protein